MICDYQNVYERSITERWDLCQRRCKTTALNRSKIKVMLSVFFDYRGVVHYGFLSPDQTVNKKYLSVIYRFREAIRKKGPDL